MSSKNDGPGSKGSGKSGDSSSQTPDKSTKKPTAIIDLKATEVRDDKSSTGADKSGQPKSTSTLKGAPGWQGGTSAASSKPEDKKPETDGVSKAGGKAPSSPLGSTTIETGAAAKPVGTTASTKTATSSAPKSSGASKSDETAKSAKAGDAKQTGAAGKGSGTPPTSSGGSGESVPLAPPPRASGGGFFGTVSHMAAGVVGGLIALFLAGPVEEQLGVRLTASPTVPAGFEQRVAALEAAPRVPSGDTSAMQTALGDLKQRVEETDKRLLIIASLQKQVASLTKDVAAAKASGGGEAPTGSAPASTATDTDATELRARLAKLESALSTLSSSTNADGSSTNVAAVAGLSGKLADLESALTTQVNALRQSLIANIEKKFASASEANSRATQGTKRLDRELADVKTDAARLTQRAATLKLANDKLAASVRALSEEAASLKVGLDGLKGDMTQALAKVARPADVSKAVSPVASKVASIEKELQSVVANESSRKANAERIVLALELANLKRALDRGAPYAAELDGVKKVAPKDMDFATLEPFKDEGVVSTGALTQRFKNVAYAIINADQSNENASRVDKLLAGVKSIIQVRRTDLPTDTKTTEATVARIEKHLKDGDLSGALAIAQKLPEKAQEPARDWMKQLAARADVDRAISRLEGQLKSSLGGGAQPPQTGTKG